MSLEGDFCTGQPIPANVSGCLDFSCCIFSGFHICVSVTELPRASENLLPGSFVSSLPASPATCDCVHLALPQ